MNIERITASEFLAASDRSVRNAADKPAFRQLIEDLKLVPKAKQRLAFDLLTMARQALEKESDPSRLIFWVGLWCDSIEEGSLLDYIHGIEGFIYAYFASRGPAKAPACGEVSAFKLTLALALTAIRKRDTQRFQAIVCALKHQCGTAERDYRSNIIAAVERMISQAEAEQ